MLSTLIISFEWVTVFWRQGPNNPTSLPAFGNNVSSVVGSIMFNYAFITAIPSWINVRVYFNH